MPVTLGIFSGPFASHLRTPVTLCTLCNSDPTGRHFMIIFRRLRRPRPTFCFSSLVFIDVYLRLMIRQYFSPLLVQNRWKAGCFESVWFASCAFVQNDRRSLCLGLFVLQRPPVGLWPQCWNRFSACFVGGGRRFLVLVGDQHSLYIPYPRNGRVNTVLEEDPARFYSEYSKPEMRLNGRSEGGIEKCRS